MNAASSNTTANTAPRLAIVRDFREEGWPSMDLVADMLFEQLRIGSMGVDAEEIAPPFRRLLSALPVLARSATSRNADRLWNRFVTLPRALRRARTGFDAFHIVDHSHAHLVHALPAERVGVCCYDLDTFRCLLEPEKEPRPLWFRWMTRRILSGLQKAAIVFHTSLEIGDKLQGLQLVEPKRLRYVRLGVAADFTPGSAGAAARLLGDGRGLDSSRYLLHVGSCIPRKRIEFLLQVFAELRDRGANLLLAKVGDSWTDAQAREIERLGIGPSIRHLGRLPRSQLIDAIRGAAAVVIPSDAEGFGLPVVEALACGVPVVASDLPTLREAGGDVANYAPVGDLERWMESIVAALTSNDDPAERRRRREWTAQFTWEAHARTIAAAYRELLARR